MSVVLREAPGHGVEEPLLNCTRCRLLHRREILRLRPAPRTNRAPEKGAGLRSG